MSASSTPSYLAGLTPEQAQAVQHKDGPVLVLAGAGSGKTRVLTSRIAHLIQAHGVSPSAILAVTFTNKAAGEMRERLLGLCGPDGAKVWMSTFHRFGARLLRTHAAEADLPPGYSIIDPDDALRLLKDLVAEQFGDIDGEGGRAKRSWDEKAVRAEISAAKNQLITPEIYNAMHMRSGPGSLEEATARLYFLYEARLRRLGAVDLDDLLMRSVALLRDHPAVLARYREQYQYILVDEYQDTNEAQYVMLEKLARPRDNLMVVGDDAQSIYAFRGANIENILNFERDFAGATVIKLEANYRSTPEILAAANAVIANNARQKQKTLRATKPAGSPLTVVHAPDDREEAGWVADAIRRYVSDGVVADYNDIAILYRSNYQSRLLEQALLRRGLPYTIVGGLAFYDRAEIKDALGYLRLLANPQDQLAFYRVVNTPRRGLGEKSAALIAEFAAAQGLTYAEALRRGREVPGLKKAGIAAAETLGDQLARWNDVRRRGSVRAVVDHILTDLDWLAQLDNAGEDGRQRADNLRELITAAAEFDDTPLEEAAAANPLLAPSSDPVTRFLEQATLVSGTDTEVPEHVVTLMTMHGSKGLEFPVVISTGWEDGSFPALRTDDLEDEEAKVEEERRLCYVTITRAQQHLVITYANARRTFGEMNECTPSRFLREIPRSLVHHVDATPEVNSSFSRIQAVFRNPHASRPGRATTVPGIHPSGRPGAQSSRPAVSDPMATVRTGRSFLASSSTTAVVPGSGTVPPSPPAASGAKPQGAPRTPPLGQADAGELPVYGRGDSVAHDQFGTGRVIAVLPVQPEPQVVVDFPSVGGKRVVPARSGGLRPL